MGDPQRGKPPGRLPQHPVERLEGGSDSRAFSDPEMGIQADTRTNRTVWKWAWSPSRRGLTTRSASAGRLHVIAYRATLDVPRELAQFVEKLLLAERGGAAPPKAAGR